jgi:hypothetical protein
MKRKMKMNKRQIKKFCKKGGHYHFDPNIRRMVKKRMMHPFVGDAGVAHCISWCEIGTCLTCSHCTDVMVDWSGKPYACYSTKINCGGSEKFSCKRYRFDDNLEYFKPEKVHPESPDSDLKKYIEEQINDLHKNRKPIEYPVVNDDLFNDKEILDYLDKLYDEQEAENESKPVPFTAEDFKEAQLAIENDLMNELIRKVEVDSEALATLTEVWSTRPDVDVNDRSIHYFVMYSGKADIFEIGKKYLLKVFDKTRCAICVEKNSSNEITFLNAIVLEDEDPCMCYEFSKSDGDEFLCSGDLIVKENEK